MYMFPDAPIAMPAGLNNLAAVARPPSPVLPQAPEPTTVDMIPVDLSTMRTPQLPLSANNKFPNASKAIP